MSGIAAVLHSDGSVVPSSDVERMLNVLKPHGPDCKRVFRHGNAAFVACLRHLTPEDVFEHQPLVIANRYVTLFDGRLDNRADLAAALGISKDKLSRMPDSMLVFLLFDRWGRSAFEKIIGVFATIIADLREGYLICARDHLGQRVLHYHHSANGFAAATCPDALFALNWVPRILNKDQIADRLLSLGTDPRATYYRNVYRVPIGSTVRVEDSKLLEEKFWDPHEISDIRFRHDSDYVEAFNEKLKIAVEATLRSKRVPCATITGGLDSSTISVVAADILAGRGARLDTYTAVPEKSFFKAETRFRYSDETPYVRQIAANNSNIIPHFVPPSDASLVEQFARVVRMGAMPDVTLNDTWFFDILTAAHSAGHDVMLTGDMGNETMSYDGRALPAKLLTSGRWLQLAVEVAHCRTRKARLIRQDLILPFVPRALLQRYKRWRRGEEPAWRAYSLISSSFVEESNCINRAAASGRHLDAPPILNGKRARILDLIDFSETADWFAALRAAHGIDIRTPAFDRRLVEFCIGIPEEQYMHKGERRWLIRRAMKNRLPESILANHKAGTQAADWFPRMTRARADLRREIHRLSGNRKVTSLIDMHLLNDVIDNWPDSEPSQSSAQAFRMSVDLPSALGAAIFVQDVTGSNLDGVN
jgi:asparagine synthase (glutamine-hydrolysing)